MDIVSLFLYLAGKVFLYFSEIEAFAGDVLFLGGISNSPVFSMDIGYLLSSNPKNNYFIEDFSRNTYFRLANQS